MGLGQNWFIFNVMGLGRNSFIFDVMGLGRNWFIFDVMGLGRMELEPLKYTSTLNVNLTERRN